MLKAHDPGHFERVLRERVAHPLDLTKLPNLPRRRRDAASRPADLARAAS
jgi:hypothetical protein